MGEAKVTPFTTVDEAIKDFQDGKFVIIVDDEDRENEGDLTLAAENVTADAINFMAKLGRGLICTPVTGKRLDELEIPLMVYHNTSSYGTAFTVTVDARRGVSTTGISAADRADTVRAMIDPDTKPADLLRPGPSSPCAMPREASSAAPARPKLQSISRSLRAVSGRCDLRDHERRRHDVASPRSRGRLLSSTTIKLISVAASSSTAGGPSASSANGAD